MVHRPNGEKKKKKKLSWEQRTQKRDDLWHTVLMYSYHDNIRKETVFTTQTLPVVRRKLKLVASDDGEWMWCLNHDFGEVLNRREFFGV